MFRTLIGATVAAALLVSTGCSARSTDDDPDRPTGHGAVSIVEALSTVEPASGPTITGAGYTYRAPEGWGPAPEAIPGFDFDTMAIDLAASEYTRNILTIRAPTPATTLDELEQSAKAEFEMLGASDVTVHDRISIDGADAIHVSAGMALNDLLTVNDQFYAIRDGQVVVANFTFTRDSDVDERAAIVASVLATWSWQD